MAKQPYIAFYVGDWLKDPNVSMCSPATRGIWFDLLCYAHELGSGGVLTGTADVLCRFGRCSHGELVGALKELSTSHSADISLRAGVYTVVNRRMKREAELASIRSKVGSKGISKRLATADSDYEAEIESEEWLRKPEFVALWDSWATHRQQLKRPLTPMARLQQIRQLKSWGENRALAAVRHSIANGWQGIFEPQNNSNKPKVFQHTPARTADPAIRRQIDAKRRELNRIMGDGFAVLAREDEDLCQKLNNEILELEKKR